MIGTLGIATLLSGIFERVTNATFIFYWVAEAVMLVFHNFHMLSNLFVKMHMNMESQFNRVGSCEKRHCVIVRRLVTQMRCTIFVEKFSTAFVPVFSPWLPLCGLIIQYLRF